MLPRSIAWVHGSPARRHAENEWQFHDAPRLLGAQHEIEQDFESGTGQPPGRVVEQFAAHGEITAQWIRNGQAAGLAGKSCDTSADESTKINAILGARSWTVSGCHHHVDFVGAQQVEHTLEQSRIVLWIGIDDGYIAGARCQHALDVFIRQAAPAFAVVDHDPFPSYIAQRLTDLPQPLFETLSFLNSRHDHRKFDLGECERPS
jgi:hypothetical protein